MTQAQVGLPLIIQQLYGGVPFTPGADTMAGGFRTSPGFRPGSPVSMTAPSTPGFTDVMPQVPGVPFGAQTTLADLVAFNPAASQYALAGFTVGEILAMPEFAGFEAQQATTGGTATSAGLAALEAQLRDTGRSPEDRPEGFGPKTSFEPTTMKFVDGKLVYDQINPAINQKILGIAPDQPVNMFPSPLAALTSLASGIVSNIPSLNRFARDKGLFSLNIRKAAALKENRDAFNKGEISETQKAVNDAKINAGFAGQSRDTAQKRMEAAAAAQKAKEEKAIQDRAAQTRKEEYRTQRDNRVSNAQRQRNRERQKEKDAKALGKARGSQGGRFNFGGR